MQSWKFITSGDLFLYQHNFQMLIISAAIVTRHFKQINYVDHKILIALYSISLYEGDAHILLKNTVF